MRFLLKALILVLVMSLLETACPIKEFGTVLALTAGTQLKWEKVIKVAGDDVEVKAIAYGKGTFVAVGNKYNEGGVIFSSKDGSKWDEIGSGYGSGVDGVKYGGGIFIANGHDSANSFVCTSTDGANWNKLDVPFEIQDVIVNGTENLILGQDYVYNIANGKLNKIW